MNTKKLFIAVFAVMFLLTGFSASVYAAGEPVGIIISMYNGAWVERDGGIKESLTLKAPIYRGDTVSTDRTGKAQILFNDDTTVAVAPKSKINIDDFVFNDAKKPYFSVKVLEGASRVISGKIVEQNPIGFKMSSPHGTAGIRGTIVSVVVGPQDDIFAVESIDPRHFVDISQNTNILNTTRSATEGYSIIVNDNPAVQNMQRKTTDEERGLMNEVFSSRPAPDTGNDKSATGEGEEAAGGTDTKTAAKDKAKKDDAKKEESGAVAGDVKSDSVAGDGKTESVVDNKNTPGVADNTIIDTVKDTDVNDKENITLPQTFNAFYNGNLNAKDAPAHFEGNFGFKVDVGLGKYSDGYMNGQAKGTGVFNAYNGQGTVNRDGSFSASSFNASGTGSYASANGGSMKGNITTSGATVDSWLVYNGNVTLIGGNGTGHKSDALNNNPYNDKKASYAGTLTANSIPPQQITNTAPEMGFGFNLLLTSGVISDAYMFYAGDEGSMKAVGGKGKANAANKDFFGSFSISGFTVTGYDLYHPTAAINGASLQGNMVNNDQGVQITGGNIGIHQFSGGDGARVDTLPGINVAPRGTYTASSSDGISPNVTYYAYGFKVNLLNAQLSDIYMYGGLQYTDTADDMFRSDDTSFWASGESGKIEADGSVNIKMKNAKFNSRYVKGQEFVLVGNFTSGYSGFNGGIEYPGPDNGYWPGPMDATKNGTWANIPFMTANYEARDLEVNRSNVSTGFKINLVSGSLSQAYLRITDVANASNKLLAYNGRGTYKRDTKTFTYIWSLDFTDPSKNSNIIGEGKYANDTLNQAIVTASFASFSDYSQAAIGINVKDRSGSSLYDSGGTFNIPKVDNLSPVMAYYSSVIDPQDGPGVILKHDGGRVGFSVNLFTGNIDDAGFYYRIKGVVNFGNGGTGTLKNDGTGKQDIDVKWTETNLVSNTVDKKFDRATLTGKLDNARLGVHDLLAPGSGEYQIDPNINFGGPIDNTGVKKGTVSGTLSGTVGGAGSSVQGAYSFNANLYSGAIDGAKIIVSAGALNNASFNNGVGYIENGGTFNISNYSGRGSGSFGAADSANMSGSVNNNNFENIKWKLMNSLNSVNAIASGTGTSGITKK